MQRCSSHALNVANQTIIFQTPVRTVEAITEVNRMSEIDRRAAIDAVSEACEELRGTFARCKEKLLSLPSAQPETCKGCKHLGKWENELEYGYPSPCTRCKRRVEDRYER